MYLIKGDKMEQTKLGLSKIIMGIFCFGSEGHEEFPRPKVYDAFFKMSKDEAFKDIFDDIYFTQLTEGKHYSKQIEEMLFRLGTGKLVEIKNPEYRVLEISKGAKESIMAYLDKHYTKEEIEIMKKAADKFRELL